MASRIAKNLVAPLWGRQPGEGDSPWIYFQRYLDLPLPRTAAACAAAAGVNAQTIQNYMSVWRWVERANALDVELGKEEAKRRLEAEAATAEARARRAADERETARIKRFNAASLLLSVASQELVRRAKQLEAVQEAERRAGAISDERLIDDRAIVRWIAEASRLQALALGETTARTEQVSTVADLDISSLTLEEVQTWRELLAKCQAPK